MKISSMMVAILVLPSLLQAASPEPSPDIRKSVVKVFVEAQEPNYFQPWQLMPQKNVTGSGAVIDGDRILTNAHVVSDSIYIKVRKAGEEKQYKARVEFVAHDSDLAVLKVDDPEFYKNSPPLHLGELPHQSDKVATYGFPMGGDELSITEGTVSRIEVHPYSHSGHRLLTIQTDAPINPGNSGGPMVENGKVIGVAFQTLSDARASNLGYVIPVTLVRRFLKDIEDGRYDGIPSLGIATQRLENDAARSLHKLAASQSGILVTQVEAGSSAAGVLRPGDVLTAIDGTSIAGDASYKLGDDSRVSYSNLVGMRQVRERLSVDVLRDGKPLALSVTLKRVSRLVAPRQYDRKPSYFIYGGLVFTPLTWNFIDLWPKEKRPTLLLYLGEFGQPTSERKELVLLSSILPDEINDGYNESAGLVVDTINGRKISALRDVPDAFSHPVDGFDVIHGDDLYSKGREIVLDAAKAEKAGPDILQRQNIPADRSADLR